MTMRALPVLLSLALAPAVLAEEGRATAAPAAGLTAGPADATPAPAVSRKGWAALGGWGYYEATHVGVSYHLDERAAFELLGGYGFGGAATTWTAGLAFAHALGRPVRGIEWGWNLKGLYWSQSDANYDWRNLSLIVGGYAVKDFGPELSLKLDAGLAVTGALDSQRKQNLNFGHPTHWNGSVCLEAVYRFGR